MKVMLDKNWAAAVSSYSGRVKNHTSFLLKGNQREATLQQLSLYCGGGGDNKNCAFQL
jgi:hypothetical protein